MRIDIGPQTPADAAQLAEVERECFAHPLEEKQLAAMLADGSLKPGRLYGMADVFPGLFG